MSFAEVMLRIGGALGAWLILIGHGLILSVLRQADCDPADDELWMGTLIFGVFGGLASLLLGLGLKWRATFRWIAVVAAPLALLALSSVLPAIAATTLGHEPLCGITATELPEGLVATGLQRTWPVVQAVVLGLGLFQMSRYWRASGISGP